MRPDLGDLWRVVKQKRMASSEEKVVHLEALPVRSSFPLSLLFPQRHHRVHPRCSPPWNPARQ
jgi:hypothetical protein